MDTLGDVFVINGSTSYFLPNLLHRLFEEIVVGNQEKAALIYEDGNILKQYSYKELNESSNRLARVLHTTIVENDLSRNDDGDYIIAVYMYPSDRLIITLLAIWKCGAAYLPLDLSFPRPRIEHILTESKPAIVVYDEDSDAFSGIKKFSYDTLLKESLNRDNSNLSRNESLEQIKGDLAIVLYTSSSTGLPKGVRLPHKVILDRLQWQFKTFPYSATEKIAISKTVLTFVDSVSEIWGPLLNGLAILVVPKTVTQDPERLIAHLEKYKIERLFLVPSLLRSLLMYLQLQKRKNALSSLKLWISSGETLPASLVKVFYAYFSKNEHRLCNFYGSTEIGDVTYHVFNGIDQLHEDQVPIGLPTDNTIIYILDSNLRPVEPGNVGELFVSGLNLAEGYVNGRDPGKFIANPLAVGDTFARLSRPGDFARMKNGIILYEGRTDSQVKIRGHRVDLSEIEKAVVSIDEVEEAVVLCYQPGERNQALLAFVITRIKIGEAQLEDILSKKLISYMMPRVIKLDDVPLLINGKVDRQALLKKYENGNNYGVEPEIDYGGIPEEKIKAAKAVFEAVASVLNRSARSTICANANFYDIGGNSLNSISTITALSENGYHISISDFILAKNLGEILDKTHNAKDTLLITETHVYTSELLKDEHKPDVLDMTVSIHEKSNLGQWLTHKMSIEDYKEAIDIFWEPLLDRNLSFVAKNKDGKVHGVALNFDGRDELEIKIKSKLYIMLKFAENIEGPVRDNVLPPGKGKILNASMLATHPALTPRENVSIIHFMEGEVLKLAKERRFAGVLTTNASPLTQQLGSDVYGYETLYDCQINEYVASDGTKPFRLAPDSQHVKVQWKSL